MPMRSSSLANNPLAITREMDGRYDVVLQVRDNLDLIEQVAGVDFEAIIAELEAAQDFTGITVVQGETVAWDAVNKILTVPKGDKGDKGNTGLTGPQGLQGIQGPQGIKGDTGLKGDTGSQGPKGFDGEDGVQGPKGDTGADLTITQITYNGNGTFNWLFSDGTVYVTPSLKGPKGDTGNQGVKGDQGISVHHIKGTSTTDAEGDFGAYGEIDTYTVYGDANETINLGFFRVNNGAAKEGQHGQMYKSTYDTTANGIVDNSEKLEGRTIAQIQADITDTIGASNGIASLDATTKLERAQVPTMNVTLEGDVSGSFAVDGSLNTTVNVVVQDNSHSHTFSNLTANPTTLSGYGITDAYTKTEVQETLPAVGLDTTNTVAPVRPGQIKWNQNEGTADLALNNGVTLQIGQENTRLVRNATLSAIPDMTVCMFDGTLGNSGRIKVAPFTGLFNQAHHIYGIATQSINAGEDGYITIDGKVRNVDTTGASVGEVWEDGDILYPKPNDAGHLTKVVPADNELKMPIASVVHAHVNGTLEVRVLPFNENMIAKRANKWTTARTITLSGDVSGSASVDGSANVIMTTTIEPNSVALGTDTTGNYVAGVTQGTGISVVGTVGEGWSPTISLTNVGTAGTYRSVTTDAQGRVTSGTNPTTLSGYGITDADTSAQVTTKINNAVAALVDASPTTLDTLNELAAALGDDPNFATTTSTALGNRVVKNADIVAGTGTKITYDAKGLVTSSTTPTTLAGYSIGDAYTKTEIDSALTLKTNKVDTDSVNMLRADKYLASQNVANMSYTNGDLTKIQYNTATDSNYEILNYTSGNLTSVNHYVSGVLKGTTTLTYTSGNLVSAIYV